MNFSAFWTIFVTIMIDRILLFPYFLTLKVKNALYNSGARKSVSADVPTICVGNVTVGGTGKTPHVEMILRMLLESDEWGAHNIAVLSRGYKRKSRGFQQVDWEGKASMYGDEPLQIKKKFPVVTVAVDKNRIEGCRFLTHPEELATSRRARKCAHKELPAADIILLDDAYQYRKLKADRNIVLVDYYRPVYDDKLLPLGRLRDLPERVGDADVIIVTKCPCELDNWEKTAFTRALGVKDYQVSTCEGKGRNGRRQLIFFTGIYYCQSRGVYPSSDPRYIYSKKVALVTGIAKDTPLRNYLSDYYKIVKGFSFPDHHRYSRSDIRKIRSVLKQYPTAAIATTEKDAQRMLDYAGMPQIIMERMFYIPIEVNFLSDYERDIFRKWLTGIAPR